MIWKWMARQMQRKLAYIPVSLLTGAILAACGPSQAELDAQATQIVSSIFATQTAEAPTITPTFTLTPTPTFTNTPSPTVTLTPTRRNDIIENFDIDPGWTRFNNPANNNDFGFRNSNLAGGTAGEAGGFFSETTVPVWYGDGSVGEFGGSDALCASGIMNIRSVDPGYNGNVFIGHFDNGEFSDGGPNGIGLQVLEPEEEDATSFRIFYLAGTDEGQRFVIEGLNLTRTWSYNYDPKAGDFGSLTISISGPGGGTATHFLASDERDSIGNFETFGLAVKPHDLESTAQAEMYVDNLRYTSSAPCKMP